MAPTAVDLGPLGGAFARAGVRTEDLHPMLIERMRLLLERTETVDDCERATRLAEFVFDRFDGGGKAFSDVEKATVRWGSLFSDIGKTGPERANPEQQQLIADMFSIERVPDGTISVDVFLHTYFPDDAPERVERFESLGLDSLMTMREFWNLHVGWTLELLHDRVAFPEFVPAAAAHHMLEHVNPAALVDDDDRFTLPYGTNTEFDRAEKLIIILDKYDAARRRSGHDHEAALQWLRQLINRNPRFSDDQEFIELLHVLDGVMHGPARALYGDSWRES